MSGAPWWAVLLGGLGGGALTFGAVYLLARNPRVKRIMIEKFRIRVDFKD
jgi:hypothetical protein